MTEEKKPENIADQDLENAQGGLLQFEIQMAKSDNPSTSREAGASDLRFGDGITGRRPVRS